MCSGCGSECKPRVRGCETEFQYAVKVVSGVVSPSTRGTVPAPPNPVAPGHYYTAINIHNPAKCGCITFRFKIAQALPILENGWRVGKITEYFSIQLCADQAAEIDNPLILRLTGQTFIKGYVVIESPEELDVVAVYTASEDDSGPCHTFSTERVPARCVPVCEDLVLPISTGVADWQTFSTPKGGPPPGPVVEVAPNPAWSTPPPSGSVWVSAAPGDSAKALSGNYTYRLIFDLCSGFSEPLLQLSGLADNSAKVSLNGNAPFLMIPDPITVASGKAPANQFQVGANVLEVTVNCLKPPITGFAIAGLLQVVRGRCPCSKLPLRPRLLFPIILPGTLPLAPTAGS